MRACLSRPLLITNISDDTCDSCLPNVAGWSFGKSFEEICRSHIEAFAKSAEKFALTTKLTDRISQWQAHLSPILEEEERKASFDIHHYSEMFLDSAVETKQEKKRRSQRQDQQLVRKALGCNV